MEVAAEGDNQGGVIHQVAQVVATDLRVYVSKKDKVYLVVMGS